MNAMTHDVIILGLGAMGSAAAFELARRGRRVLGLEQFGFGHDRGSAHGATRIIRKAYFEHPDYVPLLRRAYERWYDLEQRTGRHLFTECGCLSLGTPASELIAGVRQAAAEHRLPVEDLAHAELARRFPVFRLPADHVGVLERDAGFLHVEDCVQAHLDAARALGADLREHTPALAWRATDAAVTVTTAGETFAAAKLVIAAGAWAGQALMELGLPLTVRRKLLFWLATQDDARFRRDVFPTYLAETPAGFYYGFPVVDGHGHKLARHDGGDLVPDPTAVERSVAPGEDADVRAFAQAHLPAAAGSVRQAKVCLYTLTPDQHFILDTHPRHANVAIAAGFSGHGFKFASAVGEVLADLADAGRSALPIGMFGLARFPPGK